MTSETLLLSVQKTENSRLAQTDFSNLGFGRIMSDHMFIADYAGGAWQNSRIVPYGALSLSPATAALHYGQAIFEGMKAYKDKEGEILLFRPDENWKRLNKSAQRMCMPQISEEIFMAGLTELINLDSDWIPTQEGCALYIRPFMFASDPFIGVKASDTYTFVIFTGPVAAYFTKPPRVKIETHFIRSAEGGVGAAKCAGNYAGSLYPAMLAQQQGYDQLIWTDARDHAYIEESGAMNVMFMIGGKLITPFVSDTTLDGITRKTIVAIAHHWGIPVEERKISVAEIMEALRDQRLESAFGAGTAAVVSHISAIGYEGVDYMLPQVKPDSFAEKVKVYLGEIQTGKAKDVFGWTLKI